MQRNSQKVKTFYNKAYVRLVMVCDNDQEQVDSFFYKIRKSASNKKTDENAESTEQAPSASTPTEQTAPPAMTEEAVPSGGEQSISPPEGCPPSGV